MTTTTIASAPITKNRMLLRVTRWDPSCSSDLSTFAIKRPQQKGATPGQVRKLFRKCESVDLCAARGADRLPWIGVPRLSKSKSPADTRGAWRTPEGAGGLGTAASVSRLIRPRLMCSTKKQRSAEHSRHPSALAPHSAFPRSPPDEQTLIREDG